jgi:uncharacterized membrane protein
MLLKSKKSIFITYEECPIIILLTCMYWELIFFCTHVFVCACVCVRNSKTCGHFVVAKNTMESLTLSPLTHCSIFLYFFILVLEPFFWVISLFCGQIEGKLLQIVEEGQDWKNETKVKRVQKIGGDFKIWLRSLVWSSYF